MNSKVLLSLKMALFPYFEMKSVLNQCLLNEMVQIQPQG